MNEDTAAPRFVTNLGFDETLALVVSSVNYLPGLTSALERAFLDSIEFRRKRPRLCENSENQKSEKLCVLRFALEASEFQLQYLKLK